jgi:hypothetical protein
MRSQDGHQRRKQQIRESGRDSSWVEDEEDGTGKYGSRVKLVEAKMRAAWSRARWFREYASKKLRKGCKR